MPGLVETLSLNKNPVFHSLASKNIGKDENGHTVENIKKDRHASAGKEFFYICAMSICAVAFIIFAMLAIASAIATVDAVISGIGAPIAVPSAIFTVVWTALAGLTGYGLFYFGNKINF